MALFSFSGYEAGAHMAEETTNASKSAPLGILYTCFLCSAIGFTYLVGILFAIQGDIDKVNNGES